MSPARNVTSLIAADVQVNCRRIVRQTAKGGKSYSHTFAGTFITRDGALFSVPPASRRGNNLAPLGRELEKNMLRILLSKNLRPRADPDVVRRCETPDGLRSEFSKMLRALTGSPIPQTRSSADRSFDCLLLVEGDETAQGRNRKVNAVTVSRPVETERRAARGREGACEHALWLYRPTSLRYMIGELFRSAKLRRPFS